jgi:hypothetical protein
MARSRFHADADRGGKTEPSWLISTYLDALILGGGQYTLGAASRSGSGRGARAPGAVVWAGDRRQTPTQMSNRAQRVERLEQWLRQRLVVIDGAMGTMIQQNKLAEADYRGEHFRDWK